MTSVRPPLARRASANRKPLPPRSVAVLCGLAAFAIQLVAGWPGWLTSTSLAAYQEATSGTVTDWYSPMLVWFWSHAQVVQHGSLVPFLLQLEVFWAGVTLLAIGLQPGARWTRFLPLIVLLNPATWVVLFLWRDSAVLCGLTAALGVASLAVRSVRRGDLTQVRVALFCSAVIAGLTAAAWSRMLPLAVLMVLALCLAIVPRKAGRKTRAQISASAVLITAVAGVAGSWSLPAIVVGDVVHTRSTEALYALDAFRIDCSPLWATGQPTAQLVSPPALWQGGSAPCAHGNPASYGDAWTGLSDPTGAQVLTFGDWVGLAAHHPAIVVGGRIQQTAAMLAGPYTGLPSVDGEQVVSAPAAAGQGESAGSASRGGILLALYASVATFIPTTMVLWVLVIPMAAGWLVARRRRNTAASWGWLWPALLWPVAAAVFVGASASATDANVMAPAAAMGWIVALWALGLDSAGPLPPRLAPLADPRLAQRYSGGTPEARKPRRDRRVRRRREAVAEEPVTGDLSAFVAEYVVDGERDEVLAGADLGK